MTGADIFVQNCKDIIKEKVYADFRCPEILVEEPMDNKDRALIKEETGLEPTFNIRIYKATGSKLYGYYEYAYHKTITR